VLRVAHVASERDRARRHQRRSRRFPRRRSPPPEHRTGPRVRFGLELGPGSLMHRPRAEVIGAARGYEPGSARDHDRSKRTSPQGICTECRSRGIRTTPYVCVIVRTVPQIPWSNNRADDALGVTESRDLLGRHPRRRFRRSARRSRLALASDHALNRSIWRMKTIARSTWYPRAPSPSRIGRNRPSRSLTRFLVQPSAHATWPMSTTSFPRARGSRFGTPSISSLMSKAPCSQYGIAPGSSVIRPISLGAPQPSWKCGRRRESRQVVAGTCARAATTS